MFLLIQLNVYTPFTPSMHLLRVEHRAVMIHLVRIDVTLPQKRVDPYEMNN